MIRCFVYNFENNARKIEQKEFGTNNDAFRMKEDEEEEEEEERGYGRIGDLIKGILKKWLRTDQWTDQPTDQWTHPLIDMRGRI